jgi:hypothetical protein
VLHNFPGISPTLLSVDSSSSTLMASDGHMFRVFAAHTGACLFEVPASSTGSLVACMAPAPQVHVSALPSAHYSEVRTGARIAWWSAVWWSAHEHDGGVLFTRAAWPL